MTLSTRVTHLKRRPACAADLERARGASIAEFPVIMLFTVLLLFFPALDLLFLGIAYSAGSTLSDLQLRQAALIRYTQAEDPDGPVRKLIPDQWKNSGLGRFAKVQGNIETVVAYKDGATDENGLVEKIVQVTTTFQVDPFLNIPIPISIPGLNAPATLTFAGERPMEDPTKAP